MRAAITTLEPGRRFATTSDDSQDRASSGVTLRAFPYPYKAALAVCSDLDETPTLDDYVEMSRFLNTYDSTRLGHGVGLEIGNSIYFDMPRDQFSYWNASEPGRAAVRALIQSGHIDCLHSYGDAAATRSQAGRALDELARHGCELKVWVDHAVAPTNFGADIMRGYGDVKGSPAYHADLTCAFGIEYVWRGRVTSVIAQDVPRRLAGIADIRHPIESGVTVTKELAKGGLARAGSPKYAPHAANTTMWDASLRSGHAVREFMRSNPSWAGISRNETADGFGAVVTTAMLRTLIEREGTCILYTHLGKIGRRGTRLPASTRGAFDQLARLSNDGHLLVTTTRRLLDVCKGRRAVRWSAAEDASGLRILISLPTLRGGDARLLDGLCFYVDNPRRARIVVNGCEHPRVHVNPPDHTGRASVSLPWPRLTFPSV